MAGGNAQGGRWRAVAAVVCRCTISKQSGTEWPGPASCAPRSDAASTGVPASPSRIISPSTSGGCKIIRIPRSNPATIMFVVCA